MDLKDRENRGPKEGRKIYAYTTENDTASTQSAQKTLKLDQYIGTEQSVEQSDVIINLWVSIVRKMRLKRHSKEQSLLVGPRITRERMVQRTSARVRGVVERRGGRRSNGIFENEVVDVVLDNILNASKGVTLTLCRLSWCLEKSNS